MGSQPHSQPLQAPPQTLQMTQTMSIQTGPHVIPSSIAPAAAAPQQLAAVVPATSVASQQQPQPTQGYYPQEPSTYGPERAFATTAAGQPSAYAMPGAAAYVDPNPAAASSAAAAAAAYGVAFQPQAQQPMVIGQQIQQYQQIQQIQISAPPQLNITAQQQSQHQQQPNAADPSLALQHQQQPNGAPPSSAVMAMKVQPGGAPMPSGPHIVQGYHPYKR